MQTVATPGQFQVQRDPIVATTTANLDEQQRYSMLEQTEKKPNKAALTIVTNSRGSRSRSGSYSGDAVEHKSSPPPRVTTPKQKWMLRWSEQQHVAHVDATESHSSAVTAQAAQKEPLLEPEDSAPGSRLPVPQESHNNDRLITEPAPAPRVDDPVLTAVGPVTVTGTAAATTTNSNNTSATMSVPEDGEVVAAETTKMEIDSCAASVTETQPVAEMSSLSPSMERSNPTAASVSISPSAKVKDADSATSGLRPRTPSPSPAKLQLDASSSSSPLPAKPPVVATSLAQTGSNEQLRNDPEPLSRVSCKRKQMETPADTPVELSATERQRLERRKRRKSNWDVGDPRKHGGSVDLAALNLLSSTSTPATHPACFMKFPRQRPAYRHSHSLDSKESPLQHRSASAASPPPAAPLTVATLAESPQRALPPATASPAVPRRGFNHSASLPVDRPRDSVPSSRTGFSSSSSPLFSSSSYSRYGSGHR